MTGEPAKKEMLAWLNTKATHALSLEQRSQLLEDKMKQDTDWSSVSVSCDPLTLHRLIKKAALAPTEDQCPFAAVCNQELSFCSFCQANSMSNPQWHKPLNTKVDLGDATSVARQRKSPLEWMAAELRGSSQTTHLTFDSLTTK
jgi:hypothetical protein